MTRIPAPDDGKGGLPELLGMKVVTEGEHWLEMSMPVDERHSRPGVAGAHAGSLVSLADTACGFGCLNSLPTGAAGFSTIELKANLIGVIVNGDVVCRASAEHLGRTTQVWRAVVTNMATGKTLAIFHCTQLVLWPQPA